jgi:hypothetical protein
MGPLWSPVVATGGNQCFGRFRADLICSENRCRRLRPIAGRAHGKEEVDVEPLLSAPRCAPMPLGPRRVVVHEDKIAWHTRGPNVDRTIGSTMRRGLSGGQKAPANGPVPRGSSSGVVLPDSAYHAGGHGFESRRFRKVPAKPIFSYVFSRSEGA